MTAAADAASEATDDDRELLSRLLGRQHHVLARSQARRYGIDRFAIRNQIRAERWHLVGTRIVVLHNGPLTTEQWRWAALLHAGPQAALGGLSAAELDGLVGYPDGLITVVVPIGVRVPPLAGLRVRWSRQLSSLDVHPLRTPRRTRIARSLVDAASSAANVDRAVALLAAGVQQRLTTASQIRAVITRLGPVPRRAMLLTALDDIAGGSHALGEIDLVRLCRRAGLPLPDRQVPRRDSQGRRRWLDAHWHHYGVTAEIDGGAHRAVGAWWADMDRQNDVTLAGSQVLRFPSMLLRQHPERVVSQLAAALRTGGWTGG